jgi:hypothetical protein
MRPFLVKNKIVLYTILLYPVISLGLNSGGVVIIYLFVFISIAIAAIHSKAGFYSYLLLTLISNDYLLKGFSNPYNLYTVTIAGQSLFTYYTLVFFAIYILKYFKLPSKKIVKYQYYILALFIVSLAFNLTSDPHLSNITNDLSLIIIPLIILIVGLLSKVDLKQVLNILLTVVALKCIHNIIFYILGIGVVAGPTLRVSFDTLRVIPHFLIIFGLIKLLYGQRKTIYFVIILLGTIYTLIYASRGAILISSISIILCLGFYSYLNRKALKSSFYMILIVGTVFLSLNLLDFVRPHSTDFLQWKVTSYKPKITANYISSSGVRYLELLNITHYLSNNLKSIFFGVGPGGYFVDNYIPYVQVLYGMSAYPSDQITKREIQKPHGLPLFVLLKLGFIFSAIYYFIYYLIYKDIILEYFSSNSAIPLFLLSTLPMFFVRVFSSKLQIVLGILLLMICLIKEDDS